MHRPSQAPSRTRYAGTFTDWRFGDIENEAFDAVLMMGPLYHLVYKEDRETALREAFNRLKPGGNIFSTFISRYGIWGEVMKKIPQVIEKETGLRSELDQGRNIGERTGGFRG